MKKNQHDADYDRWGSAPGSIRIEKPKKTQKKTTRRPASKPKK